MILRSLRLMLVGSPWAATDLPLDTPLAQWLLLVGLFVLGSLLGSFANVVIYRLPAGKSLLWPGLTLSGLRPCDSLVRQCADLRLAAARRQVS